jgi:hypothetical protein
MAKFGPNNFVGLLVLAAIGGGVWLMAPTTVVPTALAPPAADQNQIVQQDLAAFVELHKIIVRLIGLAERRHKEFSAQWETDAARADFTSMYRGARDYRDAMMDLRAQATAQIVMPAERTISTTVADKIHQIRGGVVLQLAAQIEAAGLLMSLADSRDIRPSEMVALTDLKGRAQGFQYVWVTAVIDTYSSLGVPYSRINTRDGGVLQASEAQAKSADTATQPNNPTNDLEPLGRVD